MSYKYVLDSSGQDRTDIIQYVDAQGLVWTINENTADRMWLDYLDWLAAGNVPVEDPDFIETLRAVKVSEISTAASVAEASGYHSSATGQWLLYPSTLIDQVNMTASVTAAGVAMRSPIWSGDTDYKVGDLVVYDTGAFKCIVAGTSGSAIPNWPTDADASVTDGTVVWQPWSTYFKCTDSNGVAGLYFHTVKQIEQAGTDGKAAITNCQMQEANLLAEIAAAETLDELREITWTSVST